jgi:hypothetical protein
MRHGGWPEDAVRRLGPGHRAPVRPSRTVHLRSLSGGPSPNGLVSFDQHSSADGRVSAVARVYARARVADEVRMADLVVLCGDHQTIRIDGLELPETAAVAAVGMPVGRVVDHPMIDLIRDVPVVGIEHRRGEASTSLLIRLEDRRTMLAPAPSGADLSFVDVGNDLLTAIGEDPVVVLPYAPGLHLSDQS